VCLGEQRQRRVPRDHRADDADRLAQREDHVVAALEGRQRLPRPHVWPRAFVERAAGRADRQVHVGRPGDGKRRDPLPGRWMRVTPGRAGGGLDPPADQHAAVTERQLVGVRLDGRDHGSPIE
jgi:hypothetical protein